MSLNVERLVGLAYTKVKRTEPGGMMQEDTHHFSYFLELYKV